MLATQVCTVDVVVGGYARRRSACKLVELEMMVMCSCCAQLDVQVYVSEVVMPVNVVLDALCCRNSKSCPSHLVAM